MAHHSEKIPMPLHMGKAGFAPPAMDAIVDSAVDMTFPTSVRDDLSRFEFSGKQSAPNSPIGNPSAPGTPRPDITLVDGMPYTFDHLMEMGAALSKARREKKFPTTNTPSYNVKAVIDDYRDLQRLDTAREMERDARNHAFCPDISRLYIEIQRRIQDRDLAYGEVAADSNVNARLGGIANGTGAETGMYNLMRHAVQSVLRLNNLTTENDENLVDAAASRVINDIRATVQTQANCGSNGVDGVNMDKVMNNVFSAIENALSQGVGTQANRLDGQINNMSGITDTQSAQLNSMNLVTNAQTAQVNAIASHVNAIDNHVHAMGNNVNAMSSLVNSTNGNVTALSTNVVTLQTVVNMIPQVASNAVQEMLREMLPDIIGPAVEEAFEGAISNELLSRLQLFANALQEARVRAESTETHACKIPKKKSKCRSWFNIFKRRSDRHSSPRVVC